MDLEVARAYCKKSLVGAIAQLQGSVELTQLETLADLITRTMTGQWRYFHTPEHIFEVGGSVDAVEVLAALFHDLVYVQVDQDINFNISRYIAPFIKEVKGQLGILQAGELPVDPIFEIVMAVFGFAPAQVLSPFNGQNEFLSAIVAAKALEAFLLPSFIGQIAACIEATIPFRPLSPEGFSPSEELYQRLEKANHQFKFSWSQAQTIEVVKRSVRLANRDVENFAFPNSGDFLDNTWNLMPETNHELSNADSYTVQGYRRSLLKMEAFMNFLKPERVFKQFKGEPDEFTYRQLVLKTRKNLEVARLYLRVKLIAIAILEAVSYSLGRSVPLTTLMGELPRSEINTPTLEQFLIDMPIANPPETPLEREVLELLSKGRNQESVYDLKNSPIATTIIKSIGFGSVGHLNQQAKAFFSGTISAEAFLKECNADAIGRIMCAMEKLFESRAAKLKELRKKLKESCVSPLG
ncbi:MULTISPECIES: hypothetical protein [unclassified Coleofasciculus]|uniref:hypothetical protein n=1 Tax=unclassified Coleofasciculus TaxID=2692782 RepID=UPI0018804C50|nr:MULTISPECIES: hypothetical protein [unclassified Coleofasciculus]MBE9129272.1 hypothetical protein [Coleofasciculus sp. LEGE 07081]MBE9151920.1 hypothetical protein [Coleofasciculus sp. LEGE 07092]